MPSTEQLLQLIGAQHIDLLNAQKTITDLQQQLTKAQEEIKTLNGKPSSGTGPTEG